MPSFSYSSLLALVLSSVTHWGKGLLFNPSLVESCFSHCTREHLKDKGSSEMEYKNLNLGSLISSGLTLDKLLNTPEPYFPICEIRMNIAVNMLYRCCEY